MALQLGPEATNRSGPITFNLVPIGPKVKLFFVTLQILL
jgi:hypothetical protein